MLGYKKAIASSIRKLREEKGITQTELAERTGLSYASIVAYENALREPNFEATLKLEKFFNVTAAQLCGDDPLVCSNLQTLSGEQHTTFYGIGIDTGVRGKDYTGISVLCSICKQVIYSRTFGFGVEMNIIIPHTCPVCGQSAKKGGIYEEWKTTNVSTEKTT